MGLGNNGGRKFSKRREIDVTRVQVVAVKGSSRCTGFLPFYRGFSFPVRILNPFIRESFVSYVELNPICDRSKHAPVVNW